MISCLYLLSSSRCAAIIKTVGVQGILLGFVPFALLKPLDDPHTWILSMSCFIIKGIIIPLFLFRALRGVAISKEVEPYIGFTLSIVLGLVFVVCSFLVYRFISIMPLFTSPLIPVSLSMAFSGLFLIVARKQALIQIVGYLLFENGIYLFGISLSVNNPVLIEMGILLDVFVGVLVMGVVVYHINREFDSIDTQDLSVLKE